MEALNGGTRPRVRRRRRLRALLAWTSGLLLGWWVAGFAAAWVATRPRPVAIAPRAEPSAEEVRTRLLAAVGA